MTIKIIDFAKSGSIPEASVVSVGNFDGIHRGHASLLKTNVDRAAAAALKSVVVTFDPHTRSVVHDDTPQTLLTSFEEKATLLEKSGIDYLVKVPFNQAMRQKSPEIFIKEVLTGRINMKELLLGQGHTFGSGRVGNEFFLRTMESKYHFKMFVADLLHEDNGIVSSTQIREKITIGQIAEAISMLGHPYLISVERTHGLRIGTTLGYPTLNFFKPPSHKVIPPAGVYAAEFNYKGHLERGALYFGGCPTLASLNREVHFEFYSFERGEQDIPVGDRADLWLYDFIRSDGVFQDTTELTGQITIDVNKIRHFFKRRDDNAVD